MTHSVLPSYTTTFTFLLLLHQVCSFATHEHLYIGSTATLFLNNTTQQGNETLLLFPNGNTWVKFSDVVGLGGDFYGYRNAAISDAVGLEGQMTAFNNSFNTLYLASDAIAKKDPGFAPSSLYKYQSRSLITGPDATISEQIMKVVAAGKQPSVAYDDCGSSLDERRNVICGGGSILTDWVPFGRFIELCETNWDHFSFGGRAWSAYAAGHTLAIRKAQEARAVATTSETSGEIMLHAYALEAFALHFLTDAFSSGHMRTPRKKFPQVCTPDDIGSYLSRYQHDEECKYGLNVTNKQGDQWRAYGDKKYLDDVNARSRVICEACVQSSVDEIQAAFVTGTIPTNASMYAASQCIPFPDEAEGANITPLFKWTGTDLLRRKDINNLWGTTFKTHGGLDGWWSTTTLIELETQYGPPSDLPPFPNRSRLEDVKYW